MDSENENNIKDDIIENSNNPTDLSNRDVLNNEEGGLSELAEELKDNFDELNNKETYQTNPDDIAAAALADFEKDSSDENDDTDAVNVIINKSSKTPGLYKIGCTNQTKTLTCIFHFFIFTSYKQATGQKTTKGGIDIDDPGDIDGKPTTEFNLNILPDEEKSWKKPGADITDYFNYGFTEETWLKYCEKQRIIRLEYASSTIKSLSGSNSLIVLGNISGMLRSKPTFKRDTTNSHPINPVKTSTVSAVPTFSSGNLSMPPPTLPFPQATPTATLNIPAGLEGFPIPNNLAIPPPGMIPGAANFLSSMPWMGQDAFLASVAQNISGHGIQREREADDDFDRDRDRYNRRERRHDDFKKYSSRRRSRSRSQERSDRFYSSRTSRRHEEPTSGSRYSGRDRERDRKDRSPHQSSDLSRHRDNKDRDRHEHSTSRSSRSSRTHHSSSRRREDRNEESSNWDESSENRKVESLAE